MPINFRLAERLVGFADSQELVGGRVQVRYRELLSPVDGSRFLERMERLQRVLFDSIPGLSPPSMVDHLLVLISPDLTGVAYVNELQIRVEAKIFRPIKAGELVYESDIEDIATVELGIEIPEDNAVVFVRSYGWRRSLFFDFGPLFEPPVRRNYPLKQALAKQALLLLGFGGQDTNMTHPTLLAHRKQGIARLEQLLLTHCEEEKKYQELLEEHPWMFGGTYDKVVRHTHLDDEHIPDFTGRRCFDHAHDLLEIKQPFLNLFQKNGKLGANFNNAWNQTETYLAFANRNHFYLRERKGLLLENPHSLLVMGYKCPGRRYLAPAVGSANRKCSGGEGNSWNPSPFTFGGK